MDECWCGSTAAFWNYATDATDEHAACSDHVKDTGFVRIVDTKFVVKCEENTTGPKPLDAAKRELARIEKLGACRWQHCIRAIV
jgi:hypothetical protein